MLAICQACGDSVLRWFTSMSLEIGWLKRGYLQAAALQARQTLQVLRRTGDFTATYWTLETTAWIAGDRDQPERSAILLGAAAGLAASMGTQEAMVPDLLAAHERYQRQARDALGEKGFEAAFEHGRNLPLADAIAYALGERPDRSGSPPHRTPETPADPMSTLTRREREVAAHLARGL